MGIIGYTIIDLLGHFSASDTINLISLVVNVLLGILIVYLVQKGLSDDRGVKDFFIDDIKNIADEYKKFVNTLLRGKSSAAFIIDWFKTISVRLTHLEFFLENDLGVSDLTIQKLNREIHKVVTDSEEFNSQFYRKNVKLSPVVKVKLLEAHKNLKHSIINAVLKVNRA